MTTTQFLRRAKGWRMAAAFLGLLALSGCVGLPASNGSAPRRSDDPFPSVRKDNNNVPDPRFLKLNVFDA